MESNAVSTASAATSISQPLRQKSEPESSSKAGASEKAASGAAALTTTPAATQTAQAVQESKPVVNTNGQATGTTISTTA